ncbi:hypothetical protein SAMN04487983_107216 [Streptomyces sp. yr375]|uniref:hypothetical protein n=1 Tax=Streptomyces sp. yr375 TaxID=1761906 RepID=UPI0008C0097E|nr:hypothetical protein [Streptomyces sp. yr375]SES48820.1 hypothetical protein SAMN04487983_107216 [Streptomyces sp. yr375]
MRAGRILGGSIGAAALVGTSFVVATPAAAASCTAKALETVVIRSTTSTSGTALAQLNKGQSASASCTMYYGTASYEKCDIVSKRWVKVTRSGVTGYVVGTCVTIAQD